MQPSDIALCAAMRRAKIQSWVTEGVFYILLIHPLALIYTPYMMTESISLSLGTAVLACSIALLSGSRGQVAIAGVGELGLAGFAAAACDFTNASTSVAAR